MSRSPRTYAERTWQAIVVADLPLKGYTVFDDLPQICRFLEYCCAIFGYSEASFIKLITFKLLVSVLKFQDFDQLRKVPRLLTSQLWLYHFLDAVLLSNFCDIFCLHWQTWDWNYGIRNVRNKGYFCVLLLLSVTSGLPLNSVGKRKWFLFSHSLTRNDPDGIENNKKVEIEWVK